MRNSAKGKKRARVQPEPELTREASSSLSPPPDEEPKPKRSKRAVTRSCPVCEENIPVRLLAAHAELELRRVEEIMQSKDHEFMVEPEAGPSTARRGAAVKARRSMSALTPRSGPGFDTVDQTDKTIRAIKKNRKDRHAKLKLMIVQDDDDLLGALVVGDQATCPVCSMVVRGDEKFVNAHVDACLESEARRQEDAEMQEVMMHQGEEDVDPFGEFEDEDGRIRVRVGNGAALRRLGFDVRKRNQTDVDEDIDIDGEEFGDAQFTEGDIPVPRESTAEHNMEGNDEKALRDLVAAGKVVARIPLDSVVPGIKAEMEEVMGVGEADEVNEAVGLARKSGKPQQLLAALEKKIRLLESMRVTSSTATCKICLDPYSEPTTSTGCWHIYCRDCWLRCLGSTSACPICKRITTAADLRRVYM